MPPSNKPLSEAVLTQIYVGIWCHNEAKISKVIIGINVCVIHPAIAGPVYVRNTELIITGQTLW